MNSQPDCLTDYAERVYLAMKALLKKRSRTSAELHKADDNRDVAVVRNSSQKPNNIAAHDDTSKPSRNFNVSHVSHRHSLSITTTRSSRKTVFTINPLLRSYPSEKANMSSHSAKHVDLLCKDTIDLLDAIDAVDETHASKVQVLKSKSLSFGSQDKIKYLSDTSHTQRTNLFQEYHINFAMLAILKGPDIP